MCLYKYACIWIVFPVCLARFLSHLCYLSSPVPTAFPLCSSTPDIWNLTFPSLAIRQTRNVSDGSLLSCRQSGNTFDVADASHLYLMRWEMKAVLLRYPYCAHWSHKWGIGRFGDGGQIMPHLDKPGVLPALALVSWDYWLPLKDSCPQGGLLQSDEPPHLITATKKQNHFNSVLIK